MAQIRVRIGREGADDSILLLGGNPTAYGASGITARVKTKRGAIIARGINARVTAKGLKISEEAGDRCINEIRRGAREHGLDPDQTIDKINKALAKMKLSDFLPKKKK